MCVHLWKRSRQIFFGLLPLLLSKAGMCEHLDLINRTHLSAVNVSLCPGDSAMSHGESQSALAANQRLLSTCSPHAPQRHTLTSRPTSNTKSPSDAAGTAIIIPTPPSARRIVPASVSDSCRRFVRRWRQRFSETFSTLFFFVVGNPLKR